MSPADGNLSLAVFVRVAPPRHGACAFVIRNRTDNSSSNPDKTKFGSEILQDQRIENETIQ